MLDDTDSKFERLLAVLRERAPLLVAYSGGVDSAFLLAAAHRALGDRVVGVIADSPSLPRAALAEALSLAQDLGARVEVIATEELENEKYAVNPVNRCYFCKSELFTRMEALAKHRGFAGLAYGENADDATQIRPGRSAAAEFAVMAPLKEVGLTKSEIRSLSRRLGLPTADAPAQPCLSSRIPHGTPVTRDALAMVERGESFVRSLGFKIFRVRHLVDANGSCSARVQIAPAEAEALRGREQLLNDGLRAAGYSGIEIDPDGYRPPTADAGNTSP